MAGHHHCWYRWPGAVSAVASHRRMWSCDWKPHPLLPLVLAAAAGKGLWWWRRVESAPSEADLVPAAAAASGDRQEAEEQIKWV